MASVKEKNNISEDRIPVNLRGVAEVVQNEDNMLDLDDEVAFKCNTCGRCCIDTSDIILTPVDLYNMARELNTTTREVVVKYGNVIQGGSTGMPIVLLKRDAANRCLLLKKKKCTVHNGKPGACYLYPLGRAIKAEVNNPDNPFNKKVQYFMQTDLCKSHSKEERISVRDYIGEKYLAQEQACCDWLLNYGRLSSDVIGDFNDFIFKNTREFLRNFILNALVETLYIGLEEINPGELQQGLMARYNKAEQVLLDSKDLEDYYYNVMKENSLFSNDMKAIAEFYEKMTQEEFKKEFMSNALEFLAKYKKA